MPVITNTPHPRSLSSSSPRKWGSTSPHSPLSVIPTKVGIHFSTSPLFVIPTKVGIHYATSPLFVIPTKVGIHFSSFSAVKNKRKDAESAEACFFFEREELEEKKEMRA